MKLMKHQVWVLPFVIIGLVVASMFCCCFSNAWDGAVAVKASDQNLPPCHRPSTGQSSSDSKQACCSHQAFLENSETAVRVVSVIRQAIDLAAVPSSVISVRSLPRQELFLVSISPHADAVPLFLKHSVLRL